MEKVSFVAAAAAAASLNKRLFYLIEKKSWDKFPGNDVTDENRKKTKFSARDFFITLDSFLTFGLKTLFYIITPYNWVTVPTIHGLL